MSAFRTDTGTTATPFIIGGLLPDFVTVHGASGLEADAIIQLRPMEVPQCRFTYATGSTDTDFNDDGHFDAVSLRAFGTRYFHSLRLSQATVIKYPLNDNGATLADLGPSGLTTTGATAATWSLDATTKGRYVVYPTTTPITLGATTLTAVSSLTEGSISIWFSIDDPVSASVLWAFSDSDTVNADMSIWIIDDGASFTLNFQKRRTSITTQRYGYTLSDTTWHHAVMAVDSGGTKLYLDGVDVTATADTTLGDMTTDTDFFSQYTGVGFDGLHIGGWKSSNGDEFVGTSETLLSNFQVFNKALSANEITVLYNADL
jgi:Concanavalin A-like lectin/glucanases superfamily